jgi:LytTr DNA-binding domain/Histidine kinase-, DNA gyrase B-, and HSP90-like ATPase
MSRSLATFGRWRGRAIRGANRPLFQFCQPRARRHVAGEDDFRRSRSLARLLPRLTPPVRIRVEPPARDGLAPILILQPLVENAIRHGLSARVRAGRIEVTARRDGDRLTIAVEDDGVGTRAPARAGSRGGGLDRRVGQLRRAARRGPALPRARHDGTPRARLDPDCFVRIHRSSIVRIDRIKELLPDFHGDFTLVLKDGTRLTLSRTYRPKVEAVLGRGI